ncbi:unnamed protein product [Leuciscus chuanchicus]
MSDAHATHTRQQHTQHICTAAARTEPSKAEAQHTGTERNLIQKQQLHLNTHTYAEYNNRSNFTLNRSNGFNRSGCVRVEARGEAPSSVSFCPRLQQTARDRFRCECIVGERPTK